MNRLICILVLAGLAEICWADEFGDFRIPTHSVFRSAMDFQTMLNRQKSRDAINNRTSGYDWQNGQLHFNQSWRRESDQLLLDLSSNQWLNDRLSRQTFENETGPSDGNTKWYQVSTNLNARGETIWYPWEDLIGFSTDVYAYVDYSQSGRRAKDHAVNQDYFSGRFETWHEQETESWGQDYQVFLEVGPSFGRIRNVTSVASALILVQRLSEDSLIAGALSQTTKQSLAELFYRRKAYSQEYSRPDKYFWRDVEAILASDPAFRGPLDAYETQRLDEYAFASMDRMRGFVISPSVRLSHQDGYGHYWERSETLELRDSVYQYGYEQYQQSHSVRESVMWGIRGKYYRPFGLLWQLGLDGYAMYNPDQYPGPGPIHEKQLLGGLSCNLDWLIADRWFAGCDADIALRLETNDGDNTFENQQFYSEARFQFGYQLLDDVAISARLSDRYEWLKESHIDYYNLNSSRRSQRDTAFSLGVTYAFAGRLSSPSYDPPYGVTNISGH